MWPCKRAREDFFVEGTNPVFSKSFLIESKKFYIDVYENNKGKFLKISEVKSTTGQKMRINFDMGCGGEFHDRLDNFCRLLKSLEQVGNEGSGENGITLRSEEIVRNNRHYYLDLKQNYRGRFLKVSLSSHHEKNHIVIPAHGMADIRDALASIFQQFGRDETAPDGTNKLIFENKTFFFDVGENQRGRYLRISEVVGKYRAVVTVPAENWEDFIEAVEKATTPIDQTTREQATSSSHESPPPRASTPTFDELPQ